MILVQISDTHIGDADELVYGQFDTAAALTSAVDYINNMVPTPDLVIHTGDITSHGTVARYERFRELTASLVAPLVAIPGNHDDRTAMRTALAGTPILPLHPIDHSEFLHFTIDDMPVRLICCDSVIAGSTPGEMCEDRLSWLDARLNEAPDRPTIVALHHPPFYSGMTGSTAKGLKSGGIEFSNLLSQHNNIVRVIAGHVHRPITTTFGNTIAFAGPTTCYPFDLDMGPERYLNISFEPPSIAIHLWLDDATPTGPGLVTHVKPVGSWPASIPLLKGGKLVTQPGH